MMDTDLMAVLDVLVVCIQKQATAAVKKMTLPERAIPGTDSRTSSHPVQSAELQSNLSRKSPNTNDKRSNPKPETSRPQTCLPVPSG